MASLNPDQMQRAKQDLEDYPFSDQQSEICASDRHNTVPEATSKPDNKTDMSMANKDDKLTQSQLLKRMLEAEERDNARDR